MKTLLSLFVVAIFLLSIPSCTPVFSCGCDVTRTTSTGADTTFYVSSYDFKAYKKEADKYCSNVFTDSLQRKYLTDRVECFESRAPM